MNSRFSREGLTVSRAILFSGRASEPWYCCTISDEIAERMQLYGVTVLGVLLVSSLIALLLSHKLRAVIATPISQLVAGDYVGIGNRRLQHARAETFGRRIGRPGGPVQRNAGRYPVAR